MNRYYNPTPREYVSTHVDMPWEFLQGVAEQKQKGFDTALGLGDAGSKLLDFNAIPGDYERKQAKQNEYNDKFAKVTDYIQRTGDASGASRIFTSIIRDITKDRDLQIMKAAYEPWLKDREADLTLEGKATPFSRTFNYMYSTFDPELKTHKPYSQRRGYEGIAVGKQFKEELEQSIANVHADETGERIHKTVDGYWIDENKKRITKERLQPLIEASLKELVPRYAQYVGDFSNWEKKQGKSGYEWLNNMTAQITGERLVDDRSIRLIEDNFSTGKKLKELEQASNLFETTGSITKKQFNYKQISEAKDTGIAAIKALDTKIAASTNSVEKAQLTAQRDNYKQLLQIGENQLKFIDKIMTTDSNFLYIYNQYADRINAINTIKKNNGLTDLIPLETKYQFQKYMTGEKPLPTMGSATGGISGIFAEAKKKYRERAQELSSSGAYTQEDVYLVDSNEGSTFNDYSKAIKKSVFNKTINATIIGGENISSINLADYMKQDKFKSADVNKSSITPIKNTVGNQISFELILRNDKGEELEGGRVQFMSAKDGAQINSVYNKSIALNGAKSRQAGDSEGYFQSADRLANINYGEGLTMLRAFANEKKMIPETDPVQIGRFFVYNAKNDAGKPIPNVYVMTQGFIQDDGNVILSTTDVEKNPYNSSPYLSYDDIIRKIGVELIDRYAITK